MKALYYYFLAINVVTFLAFALDKYKAKNHKWRTSENTLLLLAGIGGSVGALVSMYCFRHKTKKLKFNVGVPCILVIQVLIWMYVH